MHVFPVSQSSPEQSFDALVFESGEDEVLVVELAEEVVGEHAVLYFAKGEHVQRFLVGLLSELFGEDCAFLLF